MPVGLILAGGVFFLAYWITGRLCSPDSQLRFLDLPNERSLHTTPLPRTGGLAILVSLGSVVFFGHLWGAVGDSSSLWITGSAVLIGVVSFWDDRTGLPIVVRFTVHGLAAAGVIWGAGLTLHVISVPFWGTFPLGWLAVPGTVVFLVWMTNLYNFMDGMDGFAGGMTVLGFGFWGVLALQAGHHSLAFLSVLIAAAAGGFLTYNAPPARIFMGDVGSVTLGFLAGALSLQGVKDGLSDVWVPVLIFSPFIVDATVTLVRRLLKGEEIWRAHREHYYQRLVLAGWGHRKTVLVEYMLMLVCGISAVVYVQVSEPWRLMILLGWMAVYTVLMWGVCVVERQAKVVGAAG
jgi:UDP-N-acetylmuramyl pentapeptide phosphotransferase/UDP-N-acetylglucosamine-1-phosphate transferase